MCRELLAQLQANGHPAAQQLKSNCMAIFGPVRDGGPYAHALTYMFTTVLQSFPHLALSGEHATAGKKHNAAPAPKFPVNVSKHDENKVRYAHRCPCCLLIGCSSLYLSFSVCQQMAELVAGVAKQHAIFLAHLSKAGIAQPVGEKTAAVGDLLTVKRALAAMWSTLNETEAVHQMRITFGFWHLRLALYELLNRFEDALGGVAGTLRAMMAQLDQRPVRDPKKFFHLWKDLTDAVFRAMCFAFVAQADPRFSTIRASDPSPFGEDVCLVQVVKDILTGIYSAPAAGDHDEVYNYNAVVLDLLFAIKVSTSPSCAFRSPLFWPVPSTVFIMCLSCLLLTRHPPSL
jgi:hypothetical protein